MSYTTGTGKNVTQVCDDAYIRTSATGYYYGWVRLGAIEDGGSYRSEPGKAVKISGSRTREASERLVIELDDLEVTPDNYSWLLSNCHNAQCDFAFADENNISGLSGSYTARARLLYNCSTSVHLVAQSGDVYRIKITAERTVRNADDYMEYDDIPAVEVPDQDDGGELEWVNSSTMMNFVSETLTTPATGVQVSIPVALTGLDDEDYAFKPTSAVTAIASSLPLKCEGYLESSAVGKTLTTTLIKMWFLSASKTYTYEIVAEV